MQHTDAGGGKLMLNTINAFLILQTVTVDEELLDAMN